MILNTFNNIKSSGGLNIKISNFNWNSQFNFDDNCVAFQIVMINILTGSNNGVDYTVTPLYTLDIFSDNKNYRLQFIDVASSVKGVVIASYRDRSFTVTGTNYKNLDAYKVIEFIQN